MTRDDNGIAFDPYEEDLVKRVYPDRIVRSGKNLEGGNWEIGFGFTDGVVSPEDILWTPDTSWDAGNNVFVEELDWVHKVFGVLRKNAAGGDVSLDSVPSGEVKTYSVWVNTVGPGTYITSTGSNFYLQYHPAENDSSLCVDLKYLVYAKPDTTAEGVSLTRVELPRNGEIQVNDLSSLPQWNWMVVTGDSPGTNYSTVTFPLMLTMSETPAWVQMKPGFIVIHFAEAGSHTVGISLPFGATSFPENDYYTSELLSSPVLQDYHSDISEVVMNPVTAVDESFNDDGREVEIVDTFTHAHLGGGSPTLQWATYPPLVTFAKEHDYLDVTTNEAYENFSYPTKYGHLRFVRGGNVISYKIPSAPRHDIFFVRHEEQTQAQQEANRMLNAAASKKRMHKTDPFNMMNNRGEVASLLLADQETRQRYLHRMGDLVERLMDNRIVGQTHSVYEDEPEQFAKRAGGSLASNGQGWGEFTLPGSLGNANPVSFYACTWRRSDDGLGTPLWPYDVDAAAGTVLEFLYDYYQFQGLTVADGATLPLSTLTDPNTLNIDGIYRPLEVLHDWAYMAASHDVWGGTGATMDMFEAQYAGYHAYAKLQEFLRQPQKADRARYLQAKAQLPYLLRWVFLDDYAGQYYKTVPTVRQMLSGFGETDPSGPLGPGVVHYQEHWSDWILAGQRLHPISIELYSGALRGLPGAWADRFQTMMDFLNAQRPPTFIDDMLRAAFPEAKTYALWRLGYLSNETETRGLIDDVLRGLPGTAVDGRLSQSYSYESIPLSAEDWYAENFSKEVFPSGSWFPNEVYPVLIYPALEEAVTLPVRISSWKPGNLQDAYVVSGTSPVLKLQMASADTFMLQADTYYDENGTTPENLWGINEVTVRAGQDSIPLDGMTVDTGWPGTVTDNLVSDPSFEHMGPDRSNLERAWSGSVDPDLHGNPTHARAAVAVSESAPSGTRAMRLRLDYLSGESDNAFVIHSLSWSDSARTRGRWVGSGSNWNWESGELVPYTLHFHYKVSTEDAALTVSMTEQLDRGCFRKDKDDNDQVALPTGETFCDEADALIGLTADAFGVNTLHFDWTKPGEEFSYETDEVWREFTVRGYRLAQTDSGDSVIMELQFSVKPQTIGDNGSGGSIIVLPTGQRLEAWIDEVSLTPGITGFADLYLPRQNAYYEPGDLIDVAWYPDARVHDWRSHDAAAADIAAEDPNALYTQLFWWNQDSSTWQAINEGSIGDADGGKISNGLMMWNRFNNLYSGDSRLKLRYFWGQSTAPADSAESAWFHLLPPPPDFVSQSAADFGLQALVGKEIYSSIARDYDGDGFQDLIVSVVGSSDPVGVFHNVTMVDAAMPVFSPESLAFSEGSKPYNARGLAMVDYDQDSAHRQDLFVARPDSLAGLFGYTGGTPLFRDDSARLSAGARANVWAGAFGHYRGEDPYADLYLARARMNADANSDRFSPQEFASLGEPDILLKWDAQSGVFVDVTEAAFGATLANAPSATIGAAWGKADNDPLEDLFVSFFGPHNENLTLGWLPLYIQKADGSFEDVSSQEHQDLLDPRVPYVEPLQGEGGDSEHPPDGQRERSSMGLCRWQRESGPGGLTPTRSRFGNRVEPFGAAEQWVRWFRQQGRQWSRGCRAQLQPVSRPARW